MKQYYPYIDLAKGVGILGVLMCHVAGHVFNTGEILLTHLIGTFFLSIFFLASGFVGASLFTEEAKWEDVFSWKTYCLLVPFLVLGISFTLWRDYAVYGSFTANPVVVLFANEFNSGYWFLLVLTIIRFSILLSRLILQYILLNKLFAFLSKKRGFCLVANMFVMSLLGLIFAFLLDKINFYKAYVPWYIIGALVKVYSLQNSWLKKDAVHAVFAVLAVFFIAFNYFCVDHEIHYFGQSYTSTFFMTFAVFMTLVRTNPEHPIAKAFIELGKISLDVYVLHYFFYAVDFSYMFPKGYIAEWPYALQAIVVFFVSCILIFCSYILSKIIRQNRYLTKILLGR